jgi:hypothetical protein
MALAMSFFGPLGQRTDKVMAGFSDAELATVNRFMAEMTEALTAYHREVRSAD